MELFCAMEVYIEINATHIAKTICVWTLLIVYVFRYWRSSHIAEKSNSHPLGVSISWLWTVIVFNVPARLYKYLSKVSSGYRNPWICVMFRILVNTVHHINHWEDMPICRICILHITNRSNLTAHYGKYWLNDKHNTGSTSLTLLVLVIPITVYPKKYAHGFVVLCFVVVMQSFIMYSHEVFIHIHQGCFAGRGNR